MLYSRKRKHSSISCGPRQNLSLCQEAEKGGSGSCNFQKLLACFLEFFLLCPAMED